ncbi:MAG: lysophospholipid acyltransferase family protein [Pirellulaceae bacterium]
MENKSRFLARIAGWLVAQLVRLWLCTLRVHVDDAHGIANPRASGSRRLIYCFWHEDLLSWASLFRGSGVQLLISHSRGGAVFGSMIDGLGLHASRNVGTERNGANVGVAPDGPRGPRQEFQAGALLLASRTGMPLVAMALAYDRPWRLARWDRFVIPRPFSRVVLCMNKPLPVSAGAGSKSLEDQRLRVAGMMQESASRAEALLRRWRKGERLPLVSPEAKALDALAFRKSA